MTTLIMVRRVVVGAILAILAFVSMPAMAQQSSPVTPSMLEQLTIADKLIAYGTERKDPILILATVQLRANLADGAAGRGSDEHRGCAEACV